MNKKQSNECKFPDGFLWGSASASYQVEGNIKNDWSEYGVDAGLAVNHYEAFDYDFQLAKEIGTNSHRISIEWARVEPKKGEFDYKEIEHYKDVIKSMKRHGLEPMVTLHHFTNPVWLQKDFDGWESDESVSFFLEYVKVIVNELCEDVKFWITINEPMVYAIHAYIIGKWPPFKKDYNSALDVIKNLTKAHGKAYRAIHEIYKKNPDVKIQPLVSFAKHIAILEPYFPLNPIDLVQTYIQDKVFNYKFWDSIMSGTINISIPTLKKINEPFDSDLKNSMDFVAINYYSRWFVNAKSERIVKKDVEHTDIGWEIYPEGLKKAIKMANKYASKLKIPIYITENGIDDRDDSKRIEYLKTHLTKVWETIQEGIDVRGFMYWSLMDNFEWTEGFEPLFGLIDSNRKIKNSALFYKEICLKNSIG